jgi:hypothetical protein
MKLFAITSVLALALTACGASAPPPAPLTPPSPQIIAMAHPPATLAATPAVRKIDHPMWSIEVPGSWTVEEDTDDSLVVSRDKAPGVLPARIQLVAQPLDGSEPEQFCMVVSLMAQGQVPDGIKVTDVKRSLGHWHGHTSSVTQVNTDAHVFIGVLATVDEVHKVGYAVISIAPLTPEDGKLMGTISQTFSLKTPAPPEEEAAPAPAPKPAPKATPKKR